MSPASEGAMNRRQRCGVRVVVLGQRRCVQRLVDELGDRQAAHVGYVREYDVPKPVREAFAARKAGRS